MADATGGSISYGGGKTIHTFTGSGTFVAQRENTVRVLIVGAGGAGGGGIYKNDYGGGSGGGGGGEVKDLTTVSISTGNHSIVVGDGGTTTIVNGNNGGNSSAFSNTSTGGIGGQCNNYDHTGSDYSFGGNSGNGYTGGGRSGNWSGSGAGAGANGATGDNGGKCAPGGVGVASDITGTSIGYGGGGGAGGAKQNYNEWKGGYGANAYGGGNGNSYNGSISDPGAPNDGYANRGGGGGGCRAYNEGGVSGGSPGGSGVVIISYTTNSFSVAPTITTGAATNLQPISATLNGNVTDTGGGTISTRGVCWATTANPTIANSKTATTGISGAFAVSTGQVLLPGILYHCRAYATNENGTSYGTDTTFRTPGGAILFNLL